MLTSLSFFGFWFLDAKLARFLQPSPPVVPEIGHLGNRQTGTDRYVTLRRLWGMPRRNEARAETDS
jgi:hypothetical protein